MFGYGVLCGDALVAGLIRENEMAAASERDAETMRLPLTQELAAKLIEAAINEANCRAHPLIMVPDRFRPLADKDLKPLGPLQQAGLPAAQVIIDDVLEYQGVHPEPKRYAPAIFDYDAIRHRVAQLRGDAPNGRYFREIPMAHPPGDKRIIHKVRLDQEGHDPDWFTDRCQRCLLTGRDIAENPQYRTCPGGEHGEACIECGKRWVVTFDYPIASRVTCLSCGYELIRDRDRPVKVR